MEEVNAKKVAEVVANVSSVAGTKPNEPAVPANLVEESSESPAERTDDVELSDADEVNTPTTSSKKSKNRTQMFRQGWLGDFAFLKEIDKKPFCSYCNMKLTNNKAHIERHEKSKNHQQMFKSLKQQPKIDIVNLEPTKKNEKVKTSELKIIMFILQYNLAMSLIEPLIALIKSIDGETIKDIQLGRTKLKETITSSLLEEANRDIVDVLKKQKFSVIIDETTDVSSSKCLCVVVRYFDFSYGKVRDRFLSLLELFEFDAKSIFNVIFKCFNDLSIPFTNCVGFASDNAAVMVGKKSGVRSLFLKQNPNMFTLGCMCHSIHLCSSAAAKKIPQNIEVLLRNIYVYFSHSTKKQIEFKEFQEYFNVEKHKILKTSFTRWLALEQVVARTLEQWPAILHYFLENSFESSDSNLDLVHKIQEELNDTTKLYLLFLAYVLQLTKQLNLEFQSQSVRIHKFLPYIKTFYKTILQNFVKSEFLRDEFLSDPNFNDDCLKDIDLVYVGAKAELFIKTKKLEINQVKEFKGVCREYYKTLCSQISQRIDFDDEILKSIQGIDPLNLAESSTAIISCIPDLIDKNEIENLDMEWRTLLNQTMISNSLEIEEFWSKIFFLKNALNETLFPLTKHFVSSLLSLPHSSAAAERVFSQLFLIKDKKRNRLEVNTLNAIMSCKELLNGVDCSKWNPSKSLLKSYKK